MSDDLTTLFGTDQSQQAEQLPLSASLSKLIFYYAVYAFHIKRQALFEWFT